jgi:rod shape-determining protein MreB
VLTPEEIREAIEEVVEKILDPVIRALAQTPPELAQDLLSEGAHLVGGGSLLKGFSERLSKETGVPVHLDEAPLETVVLGAGRCLESFDRLKDMLMGRPRT